MKKQDIIKDDEFTVDMCYDCMIRIYGKPLREAGAITVSMGECWECNKKKYILPSRDIYYMYSKKVTLEDWD